MKLAVMTVAVALLLPPARAMAQADSARPSTDSAPRAARPDSGRADSIPTDTLVRRPKPAPTAVPAAPPTSRALGAGECPPAAARIQGDALLRFSSPTSLPPVARSRPLLRDPTLRGRTTLAFEVDTLGRADSTTVRVVDGDPYLLPTARSSVARWRFRPAELMPGCPVRARTTATVTF